MLFSKFQKNHSIDIIVGCHQGFHDLHSFFSFFFFLAMKEKNLSSKEKRMQKSESKIALSTNVIQKMSKALKMARSRQATRHFAFLLLPQQSKAKHSACKRSRPTTVSTVTHERRRRSAEPKLKGARSRPCCALLPDSRLFLSRGRPQKCNNSCGSQCREDMRRGGGRTHTRSISTHCRNCNWDGLTTNW